MVEPETRGSLPSVRITGELARRISTGELRPGDSVPSTRQITREFGVAMATATRALTALRKQGLVYVVPGIGTVVGPRPDAEPAGAGSSATTIAGGADTGSTGSRAGIATVVGAREVPLTRERIVLAGVAVADTEGTAALSMRRVAAALDTATMSLYRHVSSKDHLLALMVDRVFMEYPLPVAGVDWRTSLEALCRLQWRTYKDHPWIAQYVSMTRPQLIPRAMAHTELAMAVLGRAGLGVGERLHAAVMLANYVRGTAVSLEPEAQAEQDTGMTNHEWMESQSLLLERIVATGQFPAFAEIATTDELELNLDTLFEFGLGRLMDGLEVLVDQRSGHPGRTRRRQRS